MLDMTRFGAAVKYCRNIKNITQLELGNLIGLSESYICLIESGKRNINLQRVFDIFEALNVEINIKNKPDQEIKLFLTLPASTHEIAATVIIP